MRMNRRGKVMRFFPAAVVLVGLMMMLGCGTTGKVERKLRPFFKSEKPLFSVGSDSEEQMTGNYGQVWDYAVAEKGNVFISDKVGKRVDKFDSKGKYLFSIGGKNHEAAGYSGWYDCIAVDKDENLYGYSVSTHSLLIFLADRKDFKVMEFNKSLNIVNVEKMKFDGSNRLFLMDYSHKMGHRLIKYDLNSGNYWVIHNDNKRVQPAFKELHLDFDLGANGDIYVADSMDYRMYLYSNEGKVLGTFFKEVKKIPIRKEDFNILMKADQIRKLPSYEDYWKKLKGDSGMFPAILGVNCDGDRVYVWSCERDEQLRVVVDIYDLNFKYVGSTSHYNVMGLNLIQIKNNLLYSPNIGYDNLEYKKQMGQFSPFVFPYKIEVFEIAKI